MSRKPSHRLARRAVSHVVHKTPNAATVRANTAKRLPHLHGEDLLKECARVARLGFGLTVWQWLPGHVGTHAANSYHKQHYPDGVGKAFDAYGASSVMDAYGTYLDTHAKQLDELIHNPTASRKFGRDVSPNYWGPVTWANHRGHVHVANDGPASRKGKR